MKYRLVNNKFAKAVRSNAVLLLGFALLNGVIVIPIVSANSTTQIQQLQEEINNVQNDSNQKKHAQSILNSEASTIAEAIAMLQGQINASEARIGQLQGDINALQAQITEAQAELDRQRKTLGEIIKTLYLDGDISTLEMLASSKDLSDFIDRQQYRENVQEKVKSTLDKVTALKLELQTKRETVQATLDEQKDLADQLIAQRAEKDRVLALNESQQANLEAQLRANSGRIVELKKKQAEAEAALARALNSGSYRTSPVGPVSGGDVVGSIGNTGFSTGAHLHLEVRSGNSTVNPGPYMRHQPTNRPPTYVSQGYGVANSWYRSGYHTGIDYAGGSGQPIFAIDGGQLYRGCSNEMLGTRNNDYGYVAIVEHPTGVKSVYAHMSGGPGACNYNTF